MAPGTAFLLLMAGALCIYLEIYKQGWILPGVTGAVLIMLGLSGFARYSVRPMGVLLLVTGLVLVVLGAWSGYRKSLGIGAAAMLIVAARNYEVPIWEALAGIIPFIIITTLLFSSGNQARKNKAIPSQ